MYSTLVRFHDLMCLKSFARGSRRARAAYAEIGPKALPMSASLIGHGSQAPFTASLASSPRGSRFFPWSASDQVRLPQALVGRDGEPRFGARLEAQQTFAASPMPSSTRSDDPAESGR